MLQYLPCKQKSHKSDYSQGHSYTNAECYICTYGKPSSKYLNTGDFKFLAFLSNIWAALLASSQAPSFYFIL